MPRDRATRLGRMTMVAALAAFAMAGEAAADAIDGDWCKATDGRRFSIRGAQIVTPGGRQMEGDHQRHYFSYVVPTGEPAAGQTIHMTLYSENIVHLRIGDDGNRTDPEVWDRCSPTTSMRIVPQPALPWRTARHFLNP